MSTLPLADQPACLLDYLRELPSGRPLLQTATLRLTAAELIARALELRLQQSRLENTVIIVHTSEPIDFIIQLAAWDGFCSHMLLLPADIAEENAEKLAATYAGFASKRRASLWMLTTSGTTGTPKVVGHCLMGLIRSLKCDTVKGAKYCWGLAYDPCRFAGLQVVLQALLAGSELVLSIPRDFNTMVTDFTEAPINALSATPTLWRKLLIDGRIKSCPLRQITLGGEIADQKLLNALRHYFPNARIVHIYASTEAGVGFSVTDGLAGFPYTYVERGITGTNLRIDTGGRLWLRPALSPADPGTMEIDPEGFINSQDRVEVRGSRVVFLGRDNGVINVGGNKVHPEEVEEILRNHYAVREARVSAKTNPIMGELVVAEIVATPGTEEPVLRRELQAHCRSHLAPYKIPALIHFVSEMTDTSAGKLKRKMNAS